MGLNAVVYKNAKQLVEVYGEGRIEIDRSTGEASVGDSGTPIPREHLVAFEQRLGNLDEIRFLRGEVEKTLGNADSILTRRVLYSGSHSGDVVAVSELPSLREEIASLKSCTNARLKVFVEAMSSLVEAAMIQQNPIVFV